MAKWEDGLAVAVIGTAVFQVAQMWRDTAPTLQDIRRSEPGDLSTKQQLLDADITVGLVAMVAGVAFAVLAGNVTALILILFAFGVLSFYYHQVAAAPSR